MALICETVTGTTMTELRRRRDASDADMVEIRLDGVTDVDVAGALEGRSRPVLVTCRALWEGGRFDGSEETRLGLLRQAFAGGAEFVDVEWKSGFGRVSAADEPRLVLSHHEMAAVPRDLADRVRAMRAAAPQAVVKIACAAGSPGDVQAIHDVATGDPGPHVAIGMGAAGFVTRACPGLFGSCWTFAGDAAPGQVGVETLSQVFRVRGQTRATQLFAITGTPLAHSASPAMHNAAFATLGIDAVYVPIESPSAPEFLSLANRLGVRGASVTAPLKTSWAAAGVALDPHASAVGAANTLKRTPSGWVGSNFDVEGFLTPLRESTIPLDGKRCVVLGAGGAARAAIVALRREGARVEISARRTDAARQLANEMGAEVASWPPEPGWDLLVNATPAGTSPRTDELPIPDNLVTGAVVYDLVYHPQETALLRVARTAGARVIGGLDMLVAQAVLQFEYWCDRPAPRDVMRRAAEVFLRKAER